HREPEFILVVTRVALEQLLQHERRFAVAPLLDANLDQRRLEALRVRRGAQHLDQVVGCTLHRLLAENLYLEQNRLLPAGFERERAIDRLQRNLARLEIGKSRVVSRERNRELRFGVVRIRWCERLDELERRELVGLRRERAI